VLKYFKHQFGAMSPRGKSSLKHDHLDNGVRLNWTRDYILDQSINLPPPPHTSQKSSCSAFPWKITPTDTPVCLPKLPQWCLKLTPARPRHIKPR